MAGKQDDTPLPGIKPMTAPPDSRVIGLDRQVPLTHQQVEAVRFGLGDTGPLAQAVMNSNVAATTKQIFNVGVSCKSDRRPADPVVGQMIFETDTQNLLFWNGTAWIYPSNSITVCTYATRPTGYLGQFAYQTDTDELLVYATDADSQDRWMQLTRFANRNIVINSCFEIWQRGTPLNMNGNSYAPGHWYTVDRFQTVRNSAVVGGTVSKQAGPTGIASCIRVQRTAGNTTTNGMDCTTSFETANVKRMHGKPVTVSFWARSGANFSSAGSGLLVQLRGGTGTDGAIISGSFVSSTNLIDTTVTLVSGTWKRYVLVYSTPLTYTQLGFVFTYNPSGTAGANDYFELTGLQIEPGTAPTELEIRNYSDELALCRQYFNLYNFTATGFANAANNGSTYSVTAPAMRAQPVLMTTPTVYPAVDDGTSAYVCNTIGSTFFGNTSMYLTYNHTNLRAAFVPSLIRGGTIGLQAEL